MTKLTVLFCILFALMSVACGSEDVPPGYKGRMFEKTGAAIFFMGNVGFTGPMLGPGTYSTGAYNELRVIECGPQTKKEELEALTKDGVQFKLDVYTRYQANCDDMKAAEYILASFNPGWQDDEKHPEWKIRIFAVQLYDTYIRPALGEAVRRSISLYDANDINAKRDLIFKQYRESFDEKINALKIKVLVIQDLNLSNLNPPEALRNANVERAQESVLKDKAIAQRARVDEEIITATNKKSLAEKEGDTEAARISRIGAALRANPEYLQFQLQQSLPEIYKTAGEKGNMIIAAPQPPMVMTTKKE